jgi:hypothetical protein
MTSHVSTLADPDSTAPAIELDVTPDDSDLTPVVAGGPPAPVTGTAEGIMDGGIVEELTNRLPTSELVKIIKGALECGRRNRPFTESDLLRAMTFGTAAFGATLGPPGAGASRAAARPPQRGPGR